MITEPTARALPLHISSLSRYSVGRLNRLHATTASIGNQTWVANLAQYLPLVLPFAYPVRRMFWLNGGTAASNVDVGLFTYGGVPLFRAGSTAQSGTSAIQYVSLGSDLLLPPGRYYLAIACDGTTNRLQASSPGNANQVRMMGVLQQASAFALPSSLTPAAWAQAAIGPCVVGITRTSTGF